MMIRQRNRVSFYFLEYPRVLISLEEIRGLVTDVSFSIRQPETLLLAQIDATVFCPPGEWSKKTGLITFIFHPNP